MAQSFVSNICRRPVSRYVLHPIRCDAMGCHLDRYDDEIIYDRSQQPVNAPWFASNWLRYDYKWNAVSLLRTALLLQTMEPYIIATSV